MTFKKAVGKIHLWLGFICGLVVIVSMSAAAVFVWEEELTDWYYSDYIFVPEVKDEALPLDELKRIAAGYLPGKRLNGAAVDCDPGRSYVFSTYKVAEHPGFWWMSSMEYRDDVYVDQYSGKVLGIVDERYNWIIMIRMLHQCLLINYEVGHLIVGIATLVIIVMLLTGLVLWWPRNKAALKQRFTIKWNAKWRRINYDIHNVGGFYAYLLIFLLAVTGLVWTFDWWTDSIYRMLGDDPEKAFAKHEPPKWSTEDVAQPARNVLADAISRKPSWTKLFLNFPMATKEHPGEYSVFLRYDEDNAWDESDGYYYHGQTGAIHHIRTQDQKLLGEKWRNSNYAIHVGSIYGLPTKILACLAALFLASLPVTGFYIWLGRKMKSGRPDGVTTKRALQRQPRPAVRIKERLPS
jgi:uncharacterized iron-regulated membrane protein